MTATALVLVACVLITAAIGGCLYLQDDTGEHAAPRDLTGDLAFRLVLATWRPRWKLYRLILRVRPATGDAHPRTWPASPVAAPEAGPAHAVPPAGPAGAASATQAGKAEAAPLYALAPALYDTGELTRLSEHTPEVIP